MKDRYINNNFYETCTIFCLRITISISGLIANFEMDFKKTIVSSTLSQYSPDLASSDRRRGFSKSRRSPRSSHEDMKWGWGDVDMTPEEIQEVNVINKSE
ncbi:hypothetical protein WN51_10825 [Melipona quadrifasciata]|uniref:Uncharacterized protein n=1 Tax=Melipona quadrifasciata TaxID=166423 RepID=A0A0M9A6P3_9HYME|nr:hypothetical protein WN51_10825 [Melipona quadrifasciata]